MVVNLIANYERERAEELLRASFAQFQNDRSLSKLRAAIRRNERRLEKALVCYHLPMSRALPAPISRVSREKNDPHGSR